MGTIKNPVVGEHYRVKISPDYGWAKVVRVLNAKEYPNDKTYKVAECEWKVYKENKTHQKRYFRLSDIIKN